MTKEMSRVRTSLNRDSTLLLIVAVLLFCVFLGYFIYGYTQFKSITEPNELMDVAEALVRENITNVRKQVQSEVDNNSEKWAEQLSQEAIKTVPKMRAQLEEFVRTQIDERVKESVKITDPQFDKLIAENNEPLKAAFKELAENRDASADLVKIITDEVDARLKANVQADADNVLNMMLQLKGKIKRLKSGENLTDEEKLEREILTTARQIQESKK